MCSLSNFDAYFVTRRHKSPKAFAFAIKSTDHLSLFENAADYCHVFSCNPKDGEAWMQSILIARVSKPYVFQLTEMFICLLVVCFIPGAQCALCQNRGIAFPSKTTRAFPNQETICIHSSRATSSQCTTSLQPGTNRQCRL